MKHQPLNQSSLGMILRLPTSATTTRQYHGSGQIVENDSLVMTRFSGGFLDGDGNVKFYFDDYQGNNIAVIDATGEMVEEMGYYPYGMPWSVPESTPYLFADKEYQSLSGLNEYIHGARRNVPYACAFSTPDALCEDRKWESPYLFCGGNPINQIDPTGNLTIFFNGFYRTGGGNPEYWGMADNIALNLLYDDNSMYYDGSMGGIWNALTDGKAYGGVLEHSSDYKNSNQFADNRYQAGYTQGAKDAKRIQETVSASGEPIYIITHSMGAAYAKGFIQALIDWGNKNNYDFTKVIKYEIDVAPYQTSQQEAVNGVSTYLLQHTDDNVAGAGPMKGTKFQMKGSTGGHDLKSFIYELILIIHYLRSSENEKTK